MKRKMFLIVISVLVLCLTCGMLFVACNDKNEGNDDGGKNPGEIDIPDTAADILTEVVKNFGEVKADTTGAKEFNLGLDITDADNKPVFSLVFETIDGDDFIYASVGDGAMTKFNGLDLGGTVETVLSWFGSGLSISGTQIPFDAEQFVASGLIETITGFNVIGNFAKSSDGNSYSLQLNLSTIAGLLSSFEQKINDGIANSGYADIINTVIDAVYGLIVPEEATTSTEGGPDDASPATVTELVEAIADNYTLTFYFGFEDNTGKDAAAEKAAQPFGDLALSSKVMAAREADARNLLNFAFDGTAELKDAEGTVTGRYDIDVDIDLDIFPLIPAILDCVTVTVDEETGSGMPSGFVVDDAKLEGIISAVKEMGYINVTVDEVNLEDNSFKKNILTIYSDFAEGNAIVQLNGEMIIIIPVAIGGVYDFDALAGFIADAIGGTVAQAEEGTEEGGEETGLDIMALLGDIFGLTNFNVFAEDFDFEAAAADVVANGLTLRMSGLMDVIDQITDVDADVALGMSLRDLLPALWKNAETMTIKIESAGFGNAVRVDQADLSAVKNDSTPSNGLVSEVTDIDIQKVVIGSLNMGLDYTYTLTGTDFNGEEVEFEGYILGYANGTSLDFTQAGEQTVTLYVAAGNVGESLIGMLTGMIDLTGYPVFGIYTIDVTFDVLSSESVLDDTAIIGANNTADETYNFSYSALSTSSMKTPFELLRAYRSGVGYTVGFQITYEGANYVFYMDQTAFNANYKILNDDGTDITATAVNESGDIVLPAGNYKIQLTYNGWTAEANLAVSTIGIAAAVADQGAPVLGEQYNYGIVITETMPDGTTETLAATNLSYRIGSTTIANMHTDEVDFDAVGTSDSSNKFLVTLDKLTNSFGAHYVTVAATSTLTESSVSSMRFDFGTVATPDSGLTATTKGTSAFGESLDNIFTITVSGQKYTLHWNGTDWDAVYADGDNAGQVNDAIDVTFELNWRADEEDEFAGGPVTLSAQGYITNNPVTNGASNMQNIDWKVTVGDMSTTGSFTISPAYVNNSEVTVGTNLSGDTGHTLNTYALADTDNNPETASVRTQVYMVWEDGAYVAKARVYNSSDKTYSFYDVDTVSISLKVIAIDGDSENDVTASIFDANGGFNAAGTYRVEFTLTTGDADYNFTTTYTVNAAAQA